MDGNPSTAETSNKTTQEPRTISPGPRRSISGFYATDMSPSTACHSRGQTQAYRSSIGKLFVYQANTPSRTSSYTECRPLVSICRATQWSRSCFQALSSPQSVVLPSRRVGNLTLRSDSSHKGKVASVFGTTSLAHRGLDLGNDSRLFNPKDSVESMPSLDHDQTFFGSCTA